MTDYLKLFEGLILLEVDPDEDGYDEEDVDDGDAPDDPGDYDEYEDGGEEEMPPDEESEEGDGEAMPPEKSEEEAIDDITKVYRMKRVYSRLIAIHKYLEYFNDHQLDDLKGKMEESIDLFHTIIMNYKSVKNRIDDIIRKYERFLVVCSGELEKFVNKRKTVKKITSDYYRRKR